jgi:hypothetical protein
MICMDYAVLQIDSSKNDDGDGCNILISSGADVSLKYVAKSKIPTPSDTLYDEFGFSLKNEKEVEKYNPTNYRTYRDHFDSLHERDLYRIEKFGQMFKTAKSGVLHKKFHNRVRKGVPNGIRQRVWDHLIPTDLFISKNVGFYQTLYDSQGAHNVLNQIDKDVNRCCRDHYLFQERYTPHQVKLFRLLKAYSIHNKELEYTQGMCTIAAVLLIYLDEEKAFWVFNHLMSHADFKCADLFLPGFPKLKETYFILNGLMKKHVPKLQTLFSHSLGGTEYDQYLDLYFRKWILLLTLTSLPFEVSIHIFDMIISEGFDVLFIVLISLFKMLHSEFMSKKSMEELKFFIQDFEHKCIDFELFLKTIQASKVTKKQIASLRRQYNAQLQKEQSNKRKSNYSI